MREAKAKPAEDAVRSAEMSDSSRSSRTDLESEPSSEEGPQHVYTQGKVVRADPNGGAAEAEHVVGADEDDSGIVEWDPRNRYCRVRARNEPRKDECGRGTRPDRGMQKTGGGHGNADEAPILQVLILEGKPCGVVRAACTRVALHRNDGRRTKGRPGA